MTASRRATAKSLAASTYTPTFLAEVGIGAMLPIFALSALSFDSGPVVAALAVGAYAFGRVGGSAWGGTLAARLGPSRGSTVALMSLALGAVICAVAPAVPLLAVGAAVVGAGHAAYHVSRQAQINTVVRASFRARALTTLAGVWRIANFVGPLAGAALIAAGGLPWAYAFAAVMVALGVGALMAARTRESAYVAPEGTVTSMRAVVRESWPVLRTLGAMVMLTGGIRAARMVVIPLWASHVGIGDEVTSLIFSASAAVDMMLFYPAGAVMDRWGRKWTAIPSTLLLAIGTVALPFTHDAWTVAAAAMVLGLGNGWGSGSLMVLAADVAPPASRDTFTGAWMILQDSGGLLMPLVVSAGAIVALPVGFFAVGGVGFATAAGLYRWIPPWRLVADSPPPEP